MCVYICKVTLLDIFIFRMWMHRKDWIRLYQAANIYNCLYLGAFQMKRTLVKKFKLRCLQSRVVYNRGQKDLYTFPSIRFRIWHRIRNEVRKASYVNVSKNIGGRNKILSSKVKIFWKLHLLNAFDFLYIKLQSNKKKPIFWEFLKNQFFHQMSTGFRIFLEKKMYNQERETCFFKLHFLNCLVTFLFPWLFC